MDLLCLRRFTAVDVCVDVESLDACSGLGGISRESGLFGDCLLSFMEVDESQLTQLV